MSKRYGRNQKRKHREQIAELSYQYDRATVIANRERATAHRLETELARWNDSIIHLLGSDTAFRRYANTLKLRSVHNFRRRPLPNDMRAAMRMAVMDRGMDAATVEVILMHKLYVYMRSNVEPLRTFIALRLEDSDHESRYAISDDMLHNIKRNGLGAREIEYIAERTARLLADHLHESLNRPPRP